MKVSVRLFRNLNSLARVHLTRYYWKWGMC